MRAGGKKTVSQCIQVCVATISIITFSIFAGGCDNIMSSPRAQAVKNMESAICRDRNVKAAEPYVTEASKPVLQLTMAGVELIQIFQKNAMADSIAQKCHNWTFRLVDEIKVDEGRYIIHTGDRNGDQQEYVVVRESGEWKVALSGK